MWEELAKLRPGNTKEHYVEVTYRDIRSNFYGSVRLNYRQQLIALGRAWKMPINAVEEKVASCQFNFFKHSLESWEAILPISLYTIAVRSVKFLDQLARGG